MLTKEQEEFIIQHYETMSIPKLAYKVGITPASLKIYINSHLKRIAKIDKDVECFIKENYKNMTQQQMADKLGVSKNTVYTWSKMLNCNKAKPKTKNVWTEEQLNYLKENYQFESRRLLALHTGQSENNVRTKLIELKLVTKEKRKRVVQPDGWSQEAIEYLINNYEYGNIRKMSAELNKSTRAIANKAARLGLKRLIRPQYNGWNIEEINYLKANYPNGNIYEMMKALNKSYNAINHAAHKHHLNRSIQFMETIPEAIVNDILIDLNVCFQREVKLIPNRNFRCDFVINMLVIEVQGDYWHANPRFFKEDDQDECQRGNVERDITKKAMLEELGYTVIYIWEYDLLHDVNSCIKYIQQNL